MKKYLGTLMGLTLMLAVAIPAAAKGKPQPPNEPELVWVTISGDAIATTCPEQWTEDGHVSDGDDVRMLMARQRDSLQPANEDRLFLNITGVDTTRKYPLPDGGGSTDGAFDRDSSFFGDGCFGGNIDGSPPGYGGLGLTIDADGALTDLRWHFDYVIVTEETTKGAPHNANRLVALEHFTFSGHDLTSVPLEGGGFEVTGDFNVLYHLAEPRGGESVDYEPVTGSPLKGLTFTFRIDPYVPQG